LPIELPCPQVLRMLRLFAEDAQASTKRECMGDERHSKIQSSKIGSGGRAQTTTNAEYGNHYLKAVTDGISKAGGSVVKAQGIVTDAAISAIKDLGGFFFGEHSHANIATKTAPQPKSYDDERSERARVWAETHALTLQGSYVNHAGMHQQLPYKRGQPFKMEATPAAPAFRQHGPSTRLLVENKDCLHAAQERVSLGLRTCVLDAGSGGHFGGGYQRGASAQEEDLCRRSCLADMVDTHLDDSLPQLYPLRTSCVMVPLVPVFRDDRHAREPYAFLDSPFIVDIGIVAAVNRPQLVKQGDELRLSSRDASHTRACIRSFFAAAQRAEARALVLVPLGCGAFCNPPGHICDIFLEVVNEFEGVFQVRCCAASFAPHVLPHASRVIRITQFIQEIVFAILDDKNTGKMHNPEGNLAPFKRRIERHNATARSQQVLSKQ
jgi:uncharacterized protein (TIGR02452 family)